MADKWYAWAPIVVGKGDKLSTIPVGTAVTPDDLGIDSERFNEYIASGAVKPVEYPEMPKSANPQSPLDFLRSQALKRVEEPELVAFDPAVAAASVGPITEGSAVAEGTERVDPEQSVEETQAAMEKAAKAEAKANETASK